ncbi:histone-binding protein N1/N2-like [Odontesthes bonariensis]|uniref:histone-binding protein N1/N2-like n=1 Tax=Odontesthes bonariensis TaxID=219752 RepID=UPI003F58CE5F
MEEANKLVGTGKKYLVVGKVVEAVSALQEACGMLAKKYGDTADECGEAFFWCGKALLDLARMENSVLGNALEGVPEEEDDKDKPKDSKVEITENIDEKARDELRVQVYDAMAEKKKEEEAEKVDGTQSEGAAETTETEKSEAAGEQHKSEKVEGDEDKENKTKTTDKAAAEGKDSADEHEEAGGHFLRRVIILSFSPQLQICDLMAAEEEEEEEEEEMDGDVEMEGDAAEQGEGDATAEKDSEDEEVGNLQLAWEMLEVAKVIYKRKDTKEDQLMAAQAHLKLGEVSAESGNYTQALEDFRECLKLQVNHLDSDSRLLAETHYQLGVTYGLNLEYSQAIEALNNSISAIKSRLGKLQEMLDKADGPEAFPDERREMEELKALLPEIQEKVEDSTEGLKMEETSAEAGKDAPDGGSTSSAFPGLSVNSSDSSSSSAVKSTSATSSASTAPVSDISHLVRKKRKPEESPVKEGNVKKVKQDEGETDPVQQPHSNGVHKANGDSNGRGEEVESR